MHADAMDSSQVFQRRLACLGDPSRFRIVQRLAEARLCVSELAGNVRLSQSCTTRHLQALTAAGLVRPERAGKRVLYVLREDDADVATLVEWVRGAATPAPTRNNGRPPATRRLTRAPAGVRRPDEAGRTSRGVPDGLQRTVQSPGSDGVADPLVTAEVNGPGPAGENEPDADSPRPMHRDEMEDFLL